MIVIVILYVISWIVFVIFFIDEVRRHEISKKYFAENWVKLMILFASGPFIMIPITIKSIEDMYKDAKEDKTFKDEKQREELRNALLMDHVKGFSKEQRHFEPSYVATFNKLHQTVKDKSYGDIIECLSKITLRRTYRMNVLECEWHEIGDKSKIYVIGWSNVPHLNYFRYANVEQSAEGAWQAYLLSTLWHILPLYWHANYDNRSLIFTKEDLLIPKYLKFVTGHKLKQIYSEVSESNIDFSPYVIEDGNHYYVSCSYWNGWKGLCREFVTVTYKDDLVSVSEPFATEVLYEYGCGFLF